MRYLTVDELKDISVGDWIYVIDKVTNNPARRRYEQKRFASEDMFVTDKGAMTRTGLSYDTYEKDWIAYKNKEQFDEQFGTKSITLEELRDVIGSSCNKQGQAKRCPDRIAQAIYEYLDSKNFLIGTYLKAPCAIGQKGWVVDHHDVNGGYTEFSV